VGAFTPKSKCSLLRCCRGKRDFLPSFPSWKITNLRLNPHLLSLYLSRQCPSSHLSPQSLVTPDHPTQSSQSLISQTFAAPNQSSSSCGEKFRHYYFLLVFMTFAAWLSPFLHGRRFISNRYQLEICGPLCAVGQKIYFF
jgi:hypothetical protein